MKKRSKFGLIVLSLICLATMIITVATFSAAGSSTSRTQNEAADQITSIAPQRTMNATRLASMWIPANLTKVEDTEDETFGHLLIYTDGSGVQSERTIWVQTWNVEFDDVEVYGSTKNWWLDGSPASEILLDDVKATLEAQIDTGHVDGSPDVQWFRLAWTSDGFGYRLVSRNIPKEDLLKIATSILGK